MNKIDKFYDIKNMMQCPICGKKIRFHDGGYVCKREHRFDISAKGYVNFLGTVKKLKGYDADFFENRRQFFEYGFYDHIAEAIEEEVDSHSEIKTVLDAGCGEGFYSRRLTARCPDMDIAAFDIAAEAVKTAASGDNKVGWLVADITNIPIKDGSIDCILDVFTPANYSQFERVLAEEGILIKAVPGENHLKELRLAAKDALRNKTYSNEEVVDYYSKNFEQISDKRASRTMKIDEEQLKLLTGMTPLLFDADKSKIDLSAVDEITIEADILVGRKK